MRRVAALDTWVGYHPQLEAEILPQTENLVAEMERLLGYENFTESSRCHLSLKGGAGHSPMPHSFREAGTA